MGQTLLQGVHWAVWAALSGGGHKAQRLLQEPQWACMGGCCFQEDKSAGVKVLENTQWSWWVAGFGE